MASLTFKWIDGDRWHLASNYGEGEYPLKMDGYISVDEQGKEQEQEQDEQEQEQE